MQYSGGPRQRAQHYREEAVKLRQMAKTFSNREIAAQFGDLAEQYDRLAERAEGDQ